MSKMIPPFYDESITSDGEKKFFRALQKLGDGYVILHSLGLARHQEKVFGEIDFVVVCRQGILCLEVKGGHVYRKEGIWYFTDRHGRETGKTEGPFRQVFTAMLSLRNHLKKQFGAGNPVAVCQFACGVVFPDMPFTQKGPDIILDVVFDSRGTQEEIEQYIEKVFEYWRNEVEAKHGFVGGKLTAIHISQVENYLRGDFGFVPSLGYIVEKTEEKLLALTGEQTERLAMASENPRILMRGWAGTGKTLLSMEHARRCAVTGKKVIYHCYNRNLASFLKAPGKEKNPDLEDSLKVDTFHGYIYNELREHGCLPAMTEDKGDGVYYRESLPEAFLDMARQTWYTLRYDNLIIDEGQDLLRFEYILCMDAMLKGGLMSGNWHICYDPNQNIFNPQFDDCFNMIMDYHPVLLSLDTNCRNTRPIGMYNTLLTGTPPARFFRVDGEGVIREAYNDFADERKKLLRTVKRMLGQGIRPGSIYILSRYKYENSCLQGENIFKGICSFQNVTDLEPVYLVEKSVKFCTIHSFKGLEAPVVIVLDIEALNSSSAKQLNYIALSRATSLLHIFYNAMVEKEMLCMINNSAGLLDIISG